MFVASVLLDFRTGVDELAVCLAPLSLRCLDADVLCNPDGVLLMVGSCTPKSIGVGGRSGSPSSTGISAADVEPSSPYPCDNRADRLVAATTFLEAVGAFARAEGIIRTAGAVFPND